MSISINNKIHLAGRFRMIEAPAAGTILPGMLVEQAATGVQAHSTAGGVGEQTYAQEDALQGRTVTDSYTVAGVGSVGPDQVTVYAEESGSLTLVLLAAGYNYTVGTKLISNGDGKMKPTTGTPAKTYGIIPQNGALDLSASGAVATLNVMRVL